MLSTQYSSPLLLRLQMSPRQGAPLAMVRHMSAQKAAGCTPELMMRWLCPSNSSRA